MSRSHRGPRGHLWGPGVALLAVVAVCLVALLRMNQGQFVYSLDDAYIHLALGENIARGHYGVNPA